MGFSVGNIAGLVGGAAGFALGGPAGAMAGYSLGSTAGNLISPPKTGNNAAANPANYPNISIPGFSFPGGGPTVNMPSYPTNLPKYTGAPLLPYNMPTLAAPTLETPTQGEQNLAGNTAQSKALSLAALDPNNPLFKNVAASQEQQINDEFLQGLRELRTNNLRSRAMGRGNILSSERGDDSLMRSLLTNNRDARLQADVNARQTVSNTAGQLNNLTGAYNSQAALENTRRTNLRNDILTRLNQLRTDTATRNSQAREDYVNSINQQRTDILTPYNNQRSDIINALNLYHNNQASIYPAQQQQTYTNNQNSAALVQAMSSLFNGGSNGGLPAGATNLGSAMPWLSAA